MAKAKQAPRCKYREGHCQSAMERAEAMQAEIKRVNDMYESLVLKHRLLEIETQERS